MFILMHCMHTACEEMDSLMRTVDTVHDIKVVSYSMIVRSFRMVVTVGILVTLLSRRLGRQYLSTLKLRQSEPRARVEYFNIYQLYPGYKLYQKL